MEKTKTFKELIVWQKSHKLVLEIYKTTKAYPKEEVKYYIILSKDLEFINEKEFNKLESITEEVGRLISGYSSAISKNN